MVHPAVYTRVWEECTPWYIPGYGRSVHPGIYASLYSLVGSLVCLPVCTPLCVPLRTVCSTCGCYTFSLVVERGRVLQRREGPSSPQNKPSFWPETERERSRNPLQKALPYKEDGNPLTPHKLLSNPPQGWSRLFHTPRGGEATLLPWVGFLIKSVKTCQNWVLPFCSKRSKLSKPVKVKTVILIKTVKIVDHSSVF